MVSGELLVTHALLSCCCSIILSRLEEHWDREESKQWAEGKKGKKGKFLGLYPVSVVEVYWRNSSVLTIPLKNLESSVKSLIWAFSGGVDRVQNLLAVYSPPNSVVLNPINTTENIQPEVFLLLH